MSLLSQSPEIIRSRRIVTPEGELDGIVLIRDGVIAAIGAAEHISAGRNVLDVGDALLLPGFVDTHVHINEPGRADWEGFASATRAAAAAGITTLVDMPLNSLPVTTTVEALRLKMEAARGRLWVDVGFHGGVVPGNEDHLEPLLEAGVLGLKAFLVDSGIPEFPEVGAYELRAAMRVLQPRQVPLLAHAELAGVGPAPGNDAESYAASRPQRWEQDAVDLLIGLCRQFRVRTHIVHLAASECVAAVREAREDGLPLTVETCPHYLFFALQGIEHDNPLFKCAPPIREASNRRNLWRALESGDIDMVVSDHSPAPPSMKTGGFAHAWGGIAGLDSGPSAIWTLLRRQQPSRLADWMARKPAALVGLMDRGALAVGKRADLVVFQPDEEYEVTEAHLHTRHRLSPYLGQRLAGVASQTFLAGRCIHDRGDLIEAPTGHILLRP